MCDGRCTFLTNVRIFFVATCKVQPEQVVLEVPDIVISGKGQERLSTDWDSLEPSLASLSTLSFTEDVK